MSRLIFVVGAILLALPSSIAQNLTLSPYSRYAIGDIYAPTTVRNASMGGIGVASDNLFSINRVNPASYADVAFTTMDVSAFFQFNQLRTDESTATPFNGGLHDAAFAFSNSRAPVIAFGFAPYSSVGYQVSSERSITLEQEYIEKVDYQGEGGLNQAFIGVGQKFFRDKLRLGLNLQYIFGNTIFSTQARVFENDTTLSLNHQPIFLNEDIFVRGFNGQIGFIYQDTISRKKNTLIRVGGVVENTLGMGGDRFRLFSNGTSSDSLGTRERGDVSLPLKFGAGLMILRPGRWSFGADVTIQDWSNLVYFTDDVNLGSEMKISAGGEITPDIESFKYFRRVNYRFGAYWKQTYIAFNDNQVQDIALTLGLGFPAGLKGNSRFNRGRAFSRINISAEVGRRGSLGADQPLEELYARLRLGFTVNDRWFIRRVVD